MNITVIEDNHADYILLKTAIIESNKRTNYKFNHFDNGKKGLNYLLSNNNDSNMVILDLNLPDVDGIDILKQVKNNKKTRHIPIIMYTTDDNQKIINKSYREFANSYILKTYNVHDLFKNIKIFSEYWNKVTILPNINIAQ